MEGIIHIAGAMPRIGTTTAAIQLVCIFKTVWLQRGICGSKQTGLSLELSFHV